MAMLRSGTHGLLSTCELLGKRQRAGERTVVVEGIGEVVLQGLQRALVGLGFLHPEACTTPCAHQNACAYTALPSAICICFAVRACKTTDLHAVLKQP